MTTTQKQSIAKIEKDRMYSAREIFQFDVPFSYPVQLNKFLVADMTADNLFETIMHKTATKTRFFVRGELLAKNLPSLTSEYVQKIISEYETKAQK